MELTRIANFKQMALLCIIRCLVEILAKFVIFLSALYIATLVQQKLAIIFTKIGQIKCFLGSND